MAIELEDDDPFQTPKPKREATSSRQAPSGAAGPHLPVAVPHCRISASPTRISAYGGKSSSLSPIKLRKKHSKKRALISGREARTAACADISPQRRVAVSRVQSLAYPPEIFVTEGEVDTMRETWAPFFFATSLGGMGSGPIFGNHRPPKSEWFKGLINGLPEGIFPPFGFSLWAAQRIAVALDLVKVPLRSPRVDKDAKQQFRQMWVVPKRSAGEAAISALKYAPATAKAWDEIAWKAAVDSVVLIFCDGGKHYVKHIGFQPAAYWPGLDSSYCTGCEYDG
eukprot:jgi/Tetstr1/447533/TSEL_034913.t1